MTISNEHPDMSGNPADMPFYCDYCNKPFKEENVCGTVHDDTVFFCSTDCVESYEESKRPE